MPYVWGGSSPKGFDCSGFIYYVYKQAGMNITRTNSEGYYARSYYVNNPQVGDLVFLPEHINQGFLMLVFISETISLSVRLQTV